MGRPPRRQGSSGLRPGSPETADRLQNGREGSVDADAVAPVRRQGSSGLRPGSPETADRLQNGRGGFGPAHCAAAFATRARRYVREANVLRN